ncbi:MAG: cyclase family protein, partial [Leptothrix sp. (in: b-proteobacteria)]
MPSLTATATAPPDRPRLWDISPPLHAGSAVFPMDTPYSQQWVARIGPGCPVNVSAITLSPHVGAHADAPLHYDDAGAPAGAMDLAPFIGPCRVIHAIGCGPLVRLSDLGHALSDLPPRVLVRTYARTPLVHFDANGSAFAPEVIDALAARGVVLVGIDSASVDPSDSKGLPSHQRLRALDLRVLENLLLD